MLPVKHTVIYTFFAITSVQNTCFCSVFNALASKNPAKSCYVQCFFHFWPFFHCRQATKMTPNSISIPSCAQTPKNPRKMSKTPPYSGLGAKPFLAPPAKADIATAILTNVIEHLVLLFCPPISTPSPPKRCGRIFWHILDMDMLPSPDLLHHLQLCAARSKLQAMHPSLGVVHYLCSQGQPHRAWTQGNNHQRFPTITS